MKLSQNVGCIGLIGALLLPLPSLAENINFGNNSSKWANDGECDDRRFRGVGMAKGLDRDDNGKDAKDCKDAYRDGRVALWDPKAAIAATQCNAIRFGNNASEWANDSECDDARFEGQGTSSVVNSDDIGKDANDCRAQCKAGTIALRDY